MDPQESLIAQHLKQFSSSDPLAEVSRPQDTFATPVQQEAETSPPFPLLPLVPPWMPWLIAVVAVSFAIGRVTSTNAGANLPRNSSNAMRPTAPPQVDSGRLLTQLLTASSTDSVSEASSGIYSWLPEATMSAAEVDSMMSKFKGLTAGRNDPFRNLLARSTPPQLATIPTHPKPILKLQPDPVAVLAPIPLPTPEPVAPPTPEAPVGARLVGVVEGLDAVALIEITRTGKSERRRIKREELLMEGYRVAEVTPRQIILHSSNEKVIGIPIGSQVMLPILPAIRSEEPEWLNKAASR
ncbi:hypothetical protein D3C72_319530 [compost metagenome]